MKVTVIGHSCLQVQTAAGTILVDPWLSGSCYYRSWWHFPPSIEVDDDLLSPDFIYLTHHHFDHFHYPSMRQISKAAQVMVPRFGVDMLAGEVRSLGFNSVRELAHGSVTDLGKGVRVGSYQYGFDDSVFVIADGDDVIVDINDAKIRGRALRQLQKDFGPITLACKSHSFAQSYPVLYTGPDPEELNLIQRHTYTDDFYDVMAELRPRYAIPFGSMVGFLHPESRSVNDHLITPEDVVDAVAAKGGLPDTVVVALIPGDSWSTADGFDRSDVDWYTDRESHLEKLAELYAPEIAERTENELGRTVEWTDFEAHLGQFVKDMPPLMGRRTAPRPVVFEVPSSPTPYWCVDLANRRVWQTATPPENRANIIHVTEAVLADSIRDRILHVVHGSMRIRTELAPDGVRSDLAFWGWLMIWELGYLPLRPQMTKPRTWGTVMRRWREFADQLRPLLSKDPVGSVSSRFGVRDDDL